MLDVAFLVAFVAFAFVLCFVFALSSFILAMFQVTSNLKSLPSTSDTTTIEANNRRDRLKISKGDTLNLYNRIVHHCPTTKTENLENTRKTEPKERRHKASVKHQLSIT